MLLEFGGVLARASRRSQPTGPSRTTLSQSEIERMGRRTTSPSRLSSSDEFVRFAPAEDLAMRRLVNEIESEQGVQPTIWEHDIPKHGLSGGQMLDVNDTHNKLLPEAESALARGDIAYVEWQIESVLDTFQVSLDAESDAYQKLGMEILRQYALYLPPEASKQRSKDGPCRRRDLPGLARKSAEGETLRAAFTGWQKDRQPAPGTLAEYQRAVDLFIELHGDLAVADIKKSHARKFREALQRKYRNG